MFKSKQKQIDQITFTHQENIKVNSQIKPVNGEFYEKFRTLMSCL